MSIVINEGIDNTYYRKSVCRHGKQILIEIDDTVGYREIIEHYDCKICEKEQEEK